MSDEYGTPEEALVEEAKNRLLEELTLYRPETVRKRLAKRINKWNEQLHQLDEQQRQLDEQQRQLNERQRQLNERHRALYDLRRSTLTPHGLQQEFSTATESLSWSELKPLNEQKARELLARKDFLTVLCAALQTGSNDIFTVANAVAQVVCTLVVAGTLALPIAPIVVVSTVLYISRMGIAVVYAGRT